LLQLLWDFDERIATTFFGRFGEYMLYTFRKND